MCSCVGTDTEPDRAGPTQLGSAANVVDADLQDPQMQVPADQNLDHEAIAADVVQADHRNRPARHTLPLSVSTRWAWGVRYAARLRPAGGRQRAGLRERAGTLRLHAC